MSWVDKVLKRVSNAIIPQYFNDTSDDWEPVKGSDGAINTKLIGSILANDVDNADTPTAITAAQDDSGKAVLRVVDAAPWGYDILSQSIRQRVPEWQKIDGLSISNTTVNAGATLLIGDSAGVNLNRYEKILIELRSTTLNITSHINVVYRTETGAQNLMNEENAVVMPLSSSVVGQTKVVELKGRLVRLSLVNSSASNNVYFVNVYGR